MTFVAAATPARQWRRLQSFGRDESRAIWDWGSGSAAAWDTARDRRRGLSHARRARSVPAPTERVEIQRGAVTDPARRGGWEHLRTVLRIQTDTFDASGTLTRTDERYLISSLPSIRLTADHWLLVARRHWGVETSHQILDNAFEEDDHPWIEACPRAALVVAILRRIAYTMLALFRSVTQRSDERRAIPWQTLLTDLFVALITNTERELRDPNPIRLR